MNDLCKMGQCAKNPYYKDPMQQWEDHKDYFTKATPTKEKRMNLYTLTARRIVGVEFIEVEAECEEDAIYKVEYGDVEPEYEQFEEYQDIEVTDVQYGDTEHYAKLGVTFITRNSKDFPNLRDALYSLLQTFDGKTVQYNDAELELVGFSIDHIEEG